MSGDLNLHDVRPSCFGHSHVYDRFASTCKSCNFASQCVGEIDMSELLADLSGDSCESSFEPVERVEKLVNTAITSSKPVLAIANDADSAPTGPGLFPIPYRFPIPETVQYANYTNAALVDELECLIQRGCLTSASPNYQMVRRDICALHIEMNLRQHHAPRFRPLSGLPKKAEGNDEETLARDRQVIDLHWRANSTDKPMIPVADFPGIFDNERFDFDLAARFAELTWRQQTKTIHLHLTDDMQWEHAIIQAPSIRDKWRTIERGDVRGSKVKQLGAPQIYTLLHQSMANESHLRTHIPGFVRIWMAQRIVGDAPQRVARLVGLMTGERAKDASATRRSMRSVEARIVAAKKGRSKV